MLRYSIGFLVILIIAAILAFGGIAVGISYTAKIVFYISLPFFAISSLFTAFIFKKHSIEHKIR